MQVFQEKVAKGSKGNHLIIYYYNLTVGTTTRVVHCKKESFDVYIGRPSKWGNPFKIGKDGSREEVIQKFRHWIHANPMLMAQLPSELKGKKLGCWCKPNACHGDVLAELADDETDPHLATIVRAIFGPKLGKFKFCHMVSANGVGIELFQFIEPASELRPEENNFEYWKTGYSHICLTEPNIEGLADKIASTGGKRRTDVMEVAPGSGKKFCFCEDPFGNVIEIYSHSYEEFWANPQRLS